ncbi:MAG: glycosyltransferase [Rhizobiales bacterium]|nr:glycosyltransferase [Hyphomicrobiales bacterium]
MWQTGKRQTPSSKCRETVGSFYRAFPLNKPITLITGIGPRPFIESPWRQLLEDHKITNLILVSSCADDAGFPTEQDLGFFNYVTKRYHLPIWQSGGIVSTFGKTAFERRILLQVLNKWVMDQPNKLNITSYLLQSGRLTENRPFASFQNERGAWEKMSYPGIPEQPWQLPQIQLAPPPMTQAQIEKWQWLENRSVVSAFWPPHRGMTHEKPDVQKRLRALSERYADRIENLAGNVQSAAQTTSPIAGTLANPQGPIALVCASLHGGGAERQVALTAAGLKRRGWPSVFVGFDEADTLETHHYSALLKNSDVPIHNARLEHVPFLDRPLQKEFNENIIEIMYDLEARCHALPLGIGPLTGQLFSQFMRLRPRLVHTWLDYTNILAGLAALWAGVPRVIMGLRNLNPMYHTGYHPFFRPLYRLMLTDPRVSLIANSHAGAKDYAAWIGIDPGDIHVVKNAFDPDSFMLGSEKMDENGPVHLSAKAHPLVLGVFRFYKEKDPFLFLRTAAAISKKSPAVRFCLVGSGVLEPQVREEARKLGIEEKLEFAGIRKNVGAYMRRADILLHCAHIEGLPNVFLEAQSVGLPVIATDAGGSAEALKPGVTGDIMPGRDPGQLAARVIKRLDEPQWLAEAGRQGPKFVAENFSYDRMLDKTLTVYNLGAFSPKIEALFPDG